MPASILLTPKYHTGFKVTAPSVTTALSCSSVMNTTIATALGPLLAMIAMNIALPALPRESVRLANQDTP